MLLETLGGLSLEGSSFTRPKPLLLLAYLALEGSRSRGYLAELFWPRAKNSRKSLRVALSQLREGAPGSVEADRKRARAGIESDAGRVLDAFESGALARGLELYVGPFCDGVRPRGVGAELEEWLYATREFLAGRVRSALLELAERSAAGAEFEAASARAEEAWELRGASALDLDELARLHALLCAGGSPHAAAAGQEARGFGLELAESAEAARARLRSAGPAPAATPLPSPPTGFVGRDLELTDVANLLTDPGCRLLTLVGPPGVGKTRLALRVAHELRRTASFADGVRFAALETLVEPDRLPSALAGAVGVEPGASEDPLAPVTRAVGGGEMLLLLDNFEQLTAGATQLARLLEACPNLTLLVTSRERLNLATERVFVVSGLPLPADAAPLDEARRVGSVRLFVERARRAKPGFELDAGSLPALRRICRRVEGLPLALELAAVWLRVLPAEEIAREIERNLAFLQTPVRDVPDRHRSLESAFEHSWRVLSPEERRTLRRLAVFRGGFRRESAAAVAGATIPQLASLVDKSLLRVDRNGRYDRHPLLHRYTREKLARDPQERADARARHGEHLAELLGRWNGWMRTGRQDEALRALDAESENVRVAWRWALEAARFDDLRCMADPLTTFFDTRGRPREGEELFARAIAELDARDDVQDVTGRDAALGAVLAAWAWLAYRRTGYAEAQRLAERSLTLLDRSRDPASAGRALNALGGAALRRGEHERARERWREALELAREQEDAEAANLHLGNLAIVDLLTGAYPSAKRRLRRVLAAYRKRGDRFRTVRPLNTLGIVHLYGGELAAAQARFEEGLELARAMEVREMIPYFLGNLADVAFEAGELERARGLGRRALDALPEGGDRSLEAANRITLGRVAVAAGDPGEARSLFLEALRIAREADATPKVLYALSGLAEVLAACGEFARAARLLDLTRHHPAAERSYHRYAERLWREVAERLSPEAVADARARAAGASLEAVTAQILRRAPPDLRP